MRKTEKRSNNWIPSGGVYNHTQIIIVYDLSD